MFVWLSENWSFAVTILSSVVLVYFSNIPLPEKPTRAQKSVRLIASSIFTLAILGSTYVDGQKNSAQIEKLVDGLGEQSKTLSGQSSTLEKQSGDLKTVATDLKSSLQLANAEALMVKVNLGAQMDAQFQIASENEIDANSNLVHALADMQLRAADLATDDLALKAERMFRDSLFFKQGDVPALNQILLKSAKDLKASVTESEKARNEVVASIGKQIQNGNIPDNFEKYVFDPIKLPLHTEGIDKLIKDCETTTNDVGELRRRIAEYSDLVSSMRQFNNRLLGTFKLFNSATKAETYHKLTDKMDKQRAELMQKFNQQPPQTN